MVQLKSLSNGELAAKTQSLAQEERRITSALLHHLREIERRMLFAERGYSSLLEYCVLELKYSESAAYRRISAMRLMREVPEVEAKLRSGALSLSTLAKAQTFFKQAEKRLHERATAAEKREVLKTLENLSSRASDRVLAERKPELAEVRPETQRALKGERVQVTLVLDKSLREKLARIQELAGRPMSMLELIEFMSEQSLRQLEKKRGRLDDSKTATPAPPLDTLSPLTPDAAASKFNYPVFRKATPTAAVPSSPKPTEARRPLSVHTQRYVWRRDLGCCQYRSPGSQRPCGSRRYLEIEHVIPIAKGGSNAPENLQLLCRTHNRYRAVQEFGRRKMSRYFTNLN